MAWAKLATVGIGIAVALHHAYRAKKAKIPPEIAMYASLAAFGGGSGFVGGICILCYAVASQINVKAADWLLGNLPSDPVFLAISGLAYLYLGMIGTSRANAWISPSKEPEAQALEKVVQYAQQRGISRDRLAELLRKRKTKRK